MLVWLVVLVVVFALVLYFANFGRAKRSQEDRIAEIQERLKEIEEKK